MSAIEAALLQLPACLKLRNLSINAGSTMGGWGFSLWWQQLALVMTGGALGAGGRYWMSGLLLRRIGEGLPWGTLAVNLVGSFAVGFLAIWLEGRGPSALYWRAFLIVGVLGGLTTYSSLMLECLLMARTDRSGALLGYLVVTLGAGLALVWLGSRAAMLVRPVW